MSILQLTNDNFDETISQGKVLVDFWAAWCGPCKIVAPVMEALAEEYAGSVTVAKVNIDEVSALADRYSIMSIPTVILFKDGIEQKRFVGALPKEEYQSVL